MKYEAFKALATEKGWTLDDLRCNTPPSDDLLETMDTIGLDKYERFVLKLEREGA